MKQNVFLCTLIRDIIADCKTVSDITLMITPFMHQ